MFIKYTLSMQRVLWRLVNDTPMQVLSTIAFNDMVGGLPSAMDSSWLNPNRWNIPVENSIFALPESLEGIATFNPLTGFIK